FFLLMLPPPSISTLFPYTTLFRSNADPRVLSSDFIPELARLADAFRPWGVRMSIAVDFSSPKGIGGLDTFDPVDPRVASWWKQRSEEHTSELQSRFDLVCRLLLEK